MEMLKTSNELCGICVYGLKDCGQARVICGYLLQAGRMRKCEVRWCDKFEEKCYFRHCYWMTLNLKMERCMLNCAVFL